ncbi:MAG TPA: hypothetical protein VF538_18050 [Pyrinomonadaceae bacterium]|jgi:hypothetical protein
MWLILSSSHDAHAQWAYAGLKARGLAPLEMVSAEALLYSPRWEHRLDADAARLSVTLRDGRAISDERVRGVLNRLTHVPTHHFSASRDHDYITQEFTAFFMSWLNALPGPVLNPVTPQGLCGRWRHPSEWVLIASAAGLPTPIYRQSSLDGLDETRAERRLFPRTTPTRHVIVVGSQVISPAAAPREIEEGCRRLAESAATPLLGVEFAATAESAWTFAGASPLPELSFGGEPLLDALAAALTAPAPVRDDLELEVAAR